MKPLRDLQIAALVALTLMGGAAAGQLFDRTDAQREVELGRQVAAEVERQIRLSRDITMRRRVERIGSALIEAMPFRAYPYRFSVLEVRDFNAFCLPGGQMYVFEGLLTRLPDDDAVAFVMAHEITHASHRHWKRMMEKMRGPAIVAALAGTALGADDVAAMAASLVSAQYSREQEDDADRGGFDLAVAAGFDPRGAVAAAEEMAKLDAGSQIPVYLRSHPPARDRLKRLEERAAASAKAQSRESAANAIRAIEDAVGAPANVKLAAQDHWPLAVGNIWTYRAVCPTGETSYALAVAGRVQTARGVVWRTETRLTGLKPTTRYVATSETGVWQRLAPAANASAWSQEWALDLGVGQSAQKGDVRWERLADEDVTVPCGRFASCMRIRRHAGNDVVTAWFARGIGMVKRVTDAIGVTELLDRYEFAAPDEGSSGTK